MVSAGSRDGVEAGQRFDLFRGDTYATTIEIEKVFEKFSSAKHIGYKAWYIPKKGEHLQGVLRTRSSVSQPSDGPDAGGASEGEASADE